MARLVTGVVEDVGLVDWRVATLEADGGQALELEESVRQAPQFDPEPAAV